MTTIEIVRHALPLRVISCEFLDYNLNLSGTDWHLNATCLYRIQSGARVFTEESDHAELQELVRRVTGSSIVAVEAGIDLDDPTFRFDNGDQLSLAADPEDPYEPWILALAEITLIGRSRQQIDRTHTRNTNVGNGEVRDLGAVLRVQQFPPGWAMVGEDWQIVVKSPSRVELGPGGLDAQGPVVPGAFVGQRIVRVEYGADRCVLHFGDGSRIVVVSDAGRSPWFLRSRARDLTVVGEAAVDG